MSENFVEYYKKAGKAVIEAKKLAIRIAKPGLSFLELAEKCETKIIDQGAELSFPINISLNSIAAHYSPPINDQTIIPEKGLLKIDMGSHYKGHIADSAFTINLDNDPKLQNYIEAAREGLNAAIDKFKPGTRLYELGEAIADEILKRGLRPITNLGGHELKPFDLHAGPFIPNFKDKTHDQVLQPGDAYACEPFATSGVGKVVNGRDAFIFRFVKKKTKNMPYELLGFMNKFEEYFKHLPFSPRWILNNDLIPEKKIDRIINNFVRKGILDKYNILIERSKKPVAQEEHTIVIDMDGNTIVITRE
ncbi:MAG: type II methionyl aminopeptidase [Candidatus Lokiarchaeota archaeon]|nr:type II methionyl aminopeptidase [Candidatus Lokiarchaeota archaeon]MBD3201545.1 type II methionyl aminopeptidase [Candidatus Lokiarchaeota archaeon]